MHEYEAGILRTEFRGAHTYFMELACDDMAGEFIPGQFVQARIGSGTDPFLRRTFSVCYADRRAGTITLMVDVIGKGTNLLCTMRRGDILNIIGPLGTGFDLRTGMKSSSVLVAGGSGAAPLIFCAERLNEVHANTVTFLMGGKIKADVDVIEGLLSDDITVLTATDDGSHGFHGFVSELFTQSIDSLNPGAVFTCGPHNMMKAVVCTTRQHGIPCQVSLEERMACGIGACRGCAVRLCDGRMVRTCREGPVFNADEIDL